MTDTYQASARHTTAGTGEAYWFFDSLMVIRADQPGQPVIIEATVAPGGGAPLHVHADLDDSFYLVSAWPPVHRLDRRGVAGAVTPRGRRRRRERRRNTA